MRDRIKRLIKRNIEVIASRQSMEMWNECKENEFVAMIPAKFGLTTNNELGSIATKSLSSFSSASDIKLDLCPVCNDVVDELAPCVSIGKTRYHMNCYFDKVERKGV